ncbi:nitroreductase family protein [Streptomyces sp. S07_1.15]|uniref:Acg family FMN-binding oxidoreductase n=1 Tax=Streptomyces sp. S07_1.15 TaxID=2873925 RepID=UPI001D137AA8|nr:nitroreductase family protein [Streptomyces sp. S07_1.15]MCC3655374.1 nitroreductase family protein [Streptomyces sp. S07_1.15]
MPVRPLDTTLVTDLVREATAAPSMHNAQPWRFRHRPGSRTVELRRDPERAMPLADPEHRALHIGCGAALFNLRVAAAGEGLRPGVRLLPDPSDPGLLASVHLTGTDGTGPDERDSPPVDGGEEPSAEPPGAEGPGAGPGGLAELRPAIPLRHTSRSPFTDRRIPEDLRNRLAEAARAEGADLAFPGIWHLRSVLSLVQDAEGRSGTDPGLRAELERWIRTGADVSARAGDGVPDYAFGPRPYGGRAAVRDFAGRDAPPDREKAVFETSPQLALLGTAEDRPADWLRAGQAMERVLLLATREGLASSLTSQALEWPDLRWLVRDPQTSMGVVQMVIRLGYGPAGPRTPRRPVEEVLDLA